MLKKEFKQHTLLQSYLLNPCVLCWLIINGIFS